MRIEIDFSNLERDHALGRPETKSLSQLRRSASGLAAVSDRRGRGTRCDGSRMGDPVFARRVQRTPVGMMESGPYHRHFVRAVERTVERTVESTDGCKGG